jgi:hypothetical protein
MYKRITHDEWEVQGFYGQWECLTTEESRQDAKNTLKDYRNNEGNVVHRIVKVRVKN